MIILNMKINQRIKATFNKANESYDDHCALQKNIGNNLVDYLTQFNYKTSRIIDLGCGTGIVTEHLMNTLTYHDFHAIDFAERMLIKTRGRLASTNIKIYSANFDNLPTFTQKFDLIFSNMALHWSNHLLQTLEMIIKQLSKNGIIAFSVPLPGTLAELQPHFSINSFFPPHLIIETLEKNTCELLLHYQEETILPFNNTLAALRSIKNVGANAATNRGKTHYYGQSDFHKIQLTKLTYHIGYFIARKRTMTCL
jgi:malonyl-CoA O-methyltransferase